MLLGASRMSWLQEPCVFIHKSGEDGSSCDCCHDPFTFWTGRSNCEFCGCVVHTKCTVKVRGTSGSRSSNRMCRTCCRYKGEYSPLLRLGDEFICYDGALPAASYVYLSEDKRSILITVDPADEIIEVPLMDIQCVQRGFSHAGHVNASNQYDPLRCFSISVRSDKHNISSRTYNLKCHSAVHCQLWVAGLNSALFVFKRLLEQEEALQQMKAEGNFTVPKKCIYFPAKKVHTDDTPMEDSCCSSKEDSMLIISDSEGREGVSSQAPDLVVIDVTDNTSSRGSTPFNDIVEVTPPPSQPTTPSPIVRKAHYKIRTIASPYRMVISRKSPQPSWDTVSTCSSDWRTKTTESAMSSNNSCGLPYKGHKNPLASYCPCHAYAIEPSSAMLVSTTHSSPQDEDPFKTCCHQCRDKCRLLRDLSLF